MCFPWSLWIVVLSKFRFSGFHEALSITGVEHGGGAGGDYYLLLSYIGAASIPLAVMSSKLMFGTCMASCPSAVPDIVYDLIVGRLKGPHDGPGINDSPRGHGVVVVCLVFSTYCSPFPTAAP